MFGESETGESPRVPSPWDALTSDRESNSSPPLHLVQESDDGNIEYKLHLINPSPARMVRLITQLKYRLLEGGGQAYYELGVADSGALIGLTREQIEQSLETLDCMAGDIGASVIVVKEIEVLAGMAGLNAFGGRRQWCRLESSGESSATDTETEVTTTTDSEDDADPESVNPTLPSYPLPTHAQSQTQLSVDLEISTVYKPRPTNTHRSTFAFKVKPRPFAPKKQKYNPPQQPHNDNEKSSALSRTRQQEKAKGRLIARDRKRDEKRRALTGITIVDPEPDSNHELESTSTFDQGGEKKQLPPDEQISAHARLVSDLQSLHVSLSISSTLPSASHAVTSLPTSIPIPTIDITSHSPSTTSSIPPTINNSFQTHSPQPTRANSSPPKRETRLIVEALVVRKLSLEEAYLDFGGFALI